MTLFQGCKLAFPPFFRRVNAKSSQIILPSKMYTLIISIYMSLRCSGMRSETTIWQDFILAVIPC